MNKQNFETYRRDIMKHRDNRNVKYKCCVMADIIEYLENPPKEKINKRVNSFKKSKIEDSE